MLSIQTRVTLLGILLFLTGSITIAQEKPNVLFIISDDLNTSIGPYINSESHTPNLSRLAAEGIKFNRAYSQFPLCGPSRASIMSGLYPETNGVLTNQHVVGSYRGSNPSLSDHPTLAGFFREQGYYTARVSKIFHMGVPGGIERGEAGDDDPDSWDYHYNVLGPETQSRGNLELLSPGNPHYGSNFSRMILKDGTEHTQTDYVATSQAIAILESRAGQLARGATNKVKVKPQAPFFLAVGLVRPHVPFVAPENCFEPYPEKAMEVPEVNIGEDVPEMALRTRNGDSWKMNNTQKKQTIGAYMASIRFMDQQVGRLLDALEELGLRDNTIVVFVSDHGYNLGEHDCWSKVSLWEGSIRVPMIISNPFFKDNHGQICESVTELIDLYPTLSELCGISDEQPEILQGKSYANYLAKGQPIEQPAVAYTVSYKGTAASIRTDDWRYTRWNDPNTTKNEELYHHENDPDELNNLAYNLTYQHQLTEMRQLLDTYRSKALNE
jgi:iduronate 2-sulfatase